MPSESTPEDAQRRALSDAALVASLFAAGCALARIRGFDHVSDDDFARVTIAQAFAVAPKLDPSGTSWLPFPFWLLGTALRVAGRTLEAARGASLVFASLAAAMPYVALRAVGVARKIALVATLASLATPWALWLGSATVPESFTASAVTAAAIALGARSAPRGARIAGALAIALACLSRYEAWPVAVVLAIALVARGVEDRDRRVALPALIAVAAPLAWMAWNAHAHGSPVHFLHRVASYRRAVGQGAGDVLPALLLYPKLLATTRPEVLVALVTTAPLLLRPHVRGRWGVALAAALAQIAFLAYGAANDGAPTHHAERALLAPAQLSVVFAIESAWSAWSSSSARARATLLVGTALAAAGALVSLRALGGPPPGSGEGEDRRAQIARGRALASLPRLHVSPCSYEHFALIAAYGAPERVVVATRPPELRAPVTPDCPGIEEEPLPP